jgi:hypothetical protein
MRIHENRCCGVEKICLRQKFNTFSQVLGIVRASQHSSSLLSNKMSVQYSRSSKKKTGVEQEENRGRARMSRQEY